MRNITLRKKLLAFIVLPVLICTSIIVIVSSINIHNQGITYLKDKSNAILGLNILEYTHNHTEGNTIAEMDVENSLQGITSDIGSSNQHYKFRIASPNPVNTKHIASAEDLEFINRFKNIDDNEIVHIDKEKNSLLVIRPVFMDEKLGCMECHSNESAGNGRLRGVFMLESDMKPIQKQVNASIIQNSLIGLLVLFLVIILAVVLSALLTKPIIELRNITENLAIGDLDHDFKYESKDEIGFIALSFNKLIKSLTKTAEFSNEIGKGNYSHDYQILSDKDIIGKSLLKMRDSLKHASAEEESRKIVDAKQNWTTHGLAKFGEILRTNSNNIKDLSFNIMSNLVNYLEINQGALFIIDDSNDEEIFLEIKSAIAYGRDKYLVKRIGIGEELVGRCAFEKATIYMTDIPKDYIKITSGMGTANPSSLLLVPLILNDEIFGVIELASFNTIEDYRIKFVERLGESIASTIATVKVNEKTSKLLGQSKSQAEELAAQEEEMRQNLEELQATQEEAARREYELSGIVKAIGSAAFTVEYDLDGVILSCNEKYAEMLGMSAQSLVGKNHQDGYNFTAEKKANYDLFWGDLSRGISKKEINSVKFNNKEFWVEEIYTPIIAQNEKTPYKILKIGFDITSQKLKEIKMQEQEIKIKQERLLLVEYQGRMADLQDKLKVAQTKITELEIKKPTIVKEITHPGKDTKVATNNLIDWSPELAMGIDEMDEQHKQLISLINAVNESFQLEKNKKEIKENIRSFIDFTSYHFGNEEQYFEQFNYTAAELHIIEHHKFLKEIKQFQEDYNGNKVKSAETFLSTIKEWLFDHFATHDANYKEAFKKNGL